MAAGIQSLPGSELLELPHQCAEMIRTICAKLDIDDEMEAGVRRLMRSEDLLAAFKAIEQDGSALDLRECGTSHAR